ncbi:RNA-directed RNA polymerase [Labeo rohita]|uniref:RNA-directed RNA polymerase n=2 Tax=Labeo rohita TaxID=84645 RepID=A0ABQ8MAI9_LABRO|nr:RNA-directed RNA polymerase [Labeo rohita]
MISPRTVCFVYFALLFGRPHANHTDTINTNTQVTSESATTNITSTINGATPTTTEIQKINSQVQTTKTSFCTQATPKPEEGHCIFFLPAGEKNLQLIVAALTVGCLVLLLTTLICAYQVCHLRGIISSLQPRYDKSDRHAVREKSESPYRDEGQVDGHPTETCIMLSEVTTQEERREDEENKSEEKKDTEQLSTEPPLKDPNGDVTQENNPEPDAKAPESSDTGV